MVSFYFSFYRRILARDPGLLNRARLRILFSCIVTFAFLTVVLATVYLTAAPSLLLYRFLSLFVLFAVTLYFFLGKRPWRLSAHLFLTALTLMIWTNFLFVHQTMYVINVQYALIVMASGYYVLGSRNGLRYSVASFVPVLTDLVFDNLAVRVPSRMADVNVTAYGITVLVNFLLLLYMHHLFFKSLRKFKKRDALFIRNLEQAVVESKQQAFAKTNFLNTMSHEIRTPLNAIVGMSHLLFSADLSKEQKEELTVLNFSAQNLMATVNDIIDFNNLDNDKVSLTDGHFNLYRTVSSVCATFKQQAALKGLEFGCKIDDELRDKVFSGDELRLSQILFHLVGNAIKFTAQGFIRIKVSREISQGQTVAVGFAISDSGIGISKAKQLEIMDPFANKQPRTQRQYHTSLGLTIASQLLKLHGSKLEITSKENRGSSFRFAITYVPSDRLAGVNLVHASSGEEVLGSLRVLCADDDKLNLMVVRKMLAKWNINCDEAVNGKLAVEACREKQYDIVLMDINMPVMDGFVASKMIKGSKAGGFYPPSIIALTASVGADKEEVLNAPGIDDCVLKPIHPQELKAKLLQFAPRP